MNDLIQKTLAQINKEHIVPEPRWKFLMQKFILWLVVGLFVALGAVAVAVTYYLLNELDWDLQLILRHNFFPYMISVMPYFWLGVLMVFLSSAMAGMRKTEDGYRFSWWKIAGIIFSGLLILSLLAYGFGLGRMINHLAINHIPYLMHHTITKEKQWMQPESGMLAGIIMTIGETQFQLQDLNGQQWIIILDEKTTVRPAVDFSVDQKIKIIGAKKDEQIFQALEIRPWEGRGRQMMNRK
jgi:hypothetical protein